MPEIVSYTTKYGIVNLYENEMYIKPVFDRGGYWDEDTLLGLKQYIDSKKSILEIGGHCGTSTLVYSRYISPPAKLFVLEPQRNLFHLLQKTVSDNHLQDMVVPIQKAGFCYSGKGYMFDTDIDGANGDIQSRYTDESRLPCNFGGLAVGRKGEEVSMTTLDELELPEIGFIHCDAQGSESFLFAKSTGLLRRDRPVIFFEDNARFNRHLYLSVCKAYPEYSEYSDFSVEDFCIDELGYRIRIENFCGSGDTLLAP